MSLQLEPCCLSGKSNTHNQESFIPPVFVLRKAVLVWVVYCIQNLKKQTRQVLDNNKFLKIHKEEACDEQQDKESVTVLLTVFWLKKVRWYQMPQIEKEH